MTFDDVRAMALALPLVEERTSDGTPAFRVGKRLIARQERDALVVRVDGPEREALLATKPERYFVTTQYEGTHWLLAKLETADPEELAGLLVAAWSRVAPPRVVEEFER